MFVGSYISELQFNPLTDVSRIFLRSSREALVDGSDLILPENFLSEAVLSLFPHLSILFESYTLGKVSFVLFAEFILLIPWQRV